MYVIFEEEGAFKTGTILADNDSSLQVETASGKRAKIKSGNVLLRYTSPAPGELLGSAEALAEGIEADFLWECAGDGEFSFCDFADDYFEQYMHRPDYNPQYSKSCGSKSGKRVKLWSPPSSTHWRQPA